jgi:hypothetical protein
MRRQAVIASLGMRAALAAVLMMVLGGFADPPASAFEFSVDANSEGGSDLSIGSPRFAIA